MGEVITREVVEQYRQIRTEAVGKTCSRLVTCRWLASRRVAVVAVVFVMLPSLVVAASLCADHFALIQGALRISYLVLLHIFAILGIGYTVFGYLINQEEDHNQALKRLSREHAREKGLQKDDPPQSA